MRRAWDPLFGVDRSGALLFLLLLAFLVSGVSEERWPRVVGAAVTGQIFLATLVARLVSMYGAPRRE